MIVGVMRSYLCKFAFKKICLCGVLIFVFLLCVLIFFSEHKLVVLVELYLSFIPFFFEERGFKFSQLR